MKYKLTIREFVPNDKYEEEYKAFQESNKPYMTNRYDENRIIAEKPEKFNLEKVLEVALTEDEFKKVKDEVIKVF